jgi:hypothetical protein
MLAIHSGHRGPSKTPSTGASRNAFRWRAIFQARRPVLWGALATITIACAGGRTPAPSQTAGARDGVAVAPTPQTFAASDACTDPTVCASSANLPDPTPDMEYGCVRQRDIPVRFLDYRDVATQGGSFLDTPTYIPMVLRELNETFARACLTFHERAHAVIQGTKFSFYFGTPTPDPAQPYLPNFDWSNPADQQQWPLAVPYNPSCSFVPPTSGVTVAGWALVGYILQKCALNDELTIVTSGQGGGGASSFPSRVAYIPPGGLYSHEVGHNFSLEHVFDGGPAWPTPLLDLTGRTQILPEWWDLVYRPGSNGQPDRFFDSYVAVGLDLDFFGSTPPITPLLFSASGHFPQGIGLPGQYVSATGTVYTYELPPKTGAVSCENPPNGQGPCSTQTETQLLDNGNYCFNCEFRRMYEAFPNNPGPIPPPNAAPLGLLYAPGQTLQDWRSTGVFSPSFSGFAYETTSEPAPGNPIRALAPPLTKLQMKHDPQRRTVQMMSYGTNFRITPSPNAPPSSDPSGVELPPPLFRAMSDSQVALVKRSFVADMRNDGIDPGNPHEFGHRPAYGSWEKLGQNLATDTVPTIVATPDGALLAAKTTDGQIAYRRWRYTDPPWASIVPGTDPPVSSVAWQTVLPAAPRALGSGSSISGAFRASVGTFDLAVRTDAGPVDEIENAVVYPDAGTAWGWGSLGGDVRGSPLLRSRVAPEGECLDVLVLGRSGDPTNDFYFFNEWSPATSDWTGWVGLPFLPGAVNDELDASVRPDGSMDIVTRTDDGSVHATFIDQDGGEWPWVDLGAPGSPGSYPPSVSTIVNDKVLPTPFVQSYIVSTDSQGQVWSKLFMDADGPTWLPSQTDWYWLGGSHFGRAIVSQNSDADIDVVVRDEDRKTVRFKRWRGVMQVWSPGDDWFDLGGDGIREPISISRPGAPEVVDVFSLAEDGTLWHRPFVVPPYVADSADQQYEVDYTNHCCSMVQTNPACPCIQ